MPDAPVKAVQPLNGEEIKQGIAAMIHAEVVTLPAEAIFASLSKSCSFNGQLFSRIRATWWVDVDGAAFKWWIDYELDDFGKVERGGIGGVIGEAGTEAKRMTGVIEPMPPDKFRRDTKQPIPVAIVPPKKEDDGVGISKTHRGKVKGKEA